MYCLAKIKNLKNLTWKIFFWSYGASGCRRKCKFINTVVSSHVFGDKWQQNTNLASARNLFLVEASTLDLQVFTATCIFLVLKKALYTSPKLPWPSLQSSSMSSCDIVHLSWRNICGQNISTRTTFFDWIARDFSIQGPWQKSRVSGNFDKEGEG